MKKLILLFAVTVLSSAMSFAQLKEGHIAYTIDISSDDPEAAMMVSMFNGSTMDLYFTEELARAELDFGALMSMTTVVNNKTEDILILMGGMMGNKAVLTNSKEMEGDDEETTVEPTVKLTKEKKTILGYKCKKALVIDEDGNEVEYWYTEAIKPVVTDAKAAASKLPGLAMEYAIDRDGMIMTFTATNIETSLTDATKNEKLSLSIPEDYEEMTYEEFIQFGGGM